MGEVTDQVTTATIATTREKKAAPTTFRSISGFALPYVIHSNQPLLYVSYFWNLRHRLVRYYWYGLILIDMGWWEDGVSQISVKYPINQVSHRKIGVSQIWSEMGWYGLIRSALGWNGLIWIDTEWYGVKWTEMDWYRVIWREMAWYGHIGISWWYSGDTAWQYMTTNDNIWYHNMS